MKRPKLADLAERVVQGDAAAAGRALSLVINESEGFEDLARRFFQHAGRCHKIGLSGPPGGGKSSLINRLVAHYRKLGEKIGVLAVDPTSPFTGGAFLGDRLRVQDHATDEGVFFRSLGSRGMMGGLTHTIFGAIHVLEAYGCDRILVETIGTGQDEVEIGRVADTIVYVTTPSLGDEIQAMKAGAMEIADLFVVNKSELPGADKAAAALKSALELGSRRKDQAWEPRIVAVSALLNQGIGELTKALEAHRDHLRRTNEGRERQRAQLKEELSLYISRRLTRDVLSRISDRHLDLLQSKGADPVSLGEKLISRK